MRNCLILGSGRSGTSMVAGTLAAAGYTMGEGLHPARLSNPKGFFEAPEINGLNEELLAGQLESTPALGEGQRWLGRPRADARFEPTAEQRERMASATAREPWCFKDPRFSFTLDAWRPHLGDAGLVCVFRHPARTAVSLVEEVGRAAYLADVELELADAFALWIATYREVLAAAERGGSWLFLHYDQALTSEGRARLEGFLEVEVDGKFADPCLRRDLPDVEVPAQALELYEELCRRAEFQPLDEAPPAEDAHPDVSVICLVEEHERERVDELVEDVRAQRGLRAELVLVDRGGAVALESDAARVVACDHPSRGIAWKAGLSAARADTVALAALGSRLLPAHLAHARTALTEEVQLVTSDAVLTDAQGQFIDRTFIDAMPAGPGHGFEAGLLARRGALEELREEAFFPAERALLAELGARGQVAHVSEPGHTLPYATYHAGWERARDDATLVELAAAPRDEGAPRLSVSLCTFQRREVLAECLESFARQLVAPGTFELVVVNDGSSDGTREYLDRLELHVPLRVIHRENGGLAAARNSGLSIARGEFVLFINDDTIARPDLVEAHLAAHARLDGARACVLGTFEQPPEALDNALMRYLEGSNEVFDFATLEAGPLDGLHFYTCNVSTPTDAVRAVGAFDASFRHYGCEDTDLGLRLEAAGYTVHHEPRARATHRHVLSFEDLRRRQHTVAKAYVRLFRKHPALIERWRVGHLGAEWIEGHLGASASERRELEAVARQLASLDVGRLERLGGAFATEAEGVLARLGEALRGLNGSWWAAGYLEGLREHGLEGFAELLTPPSDGASFPSTTGRALLAWPRWRDADELARLMERIRPIATDAFATLVLVHDPARDGDLEVALEALEAAAAKAYEEEPALEVEVLTQALERADLFALTHTTRGLLPLGGEPASFLEGVGCERLESTEAVAAWRERFGEVRAPREPSAPREPRPELSVIVPTHDRPRELEGLLDALARQSLAPESFEVLVVDDGSRVSAAGVLAGREDPYALRILRREGGGPGAARNAGAREARGRTLVLFNDDALPDADCLRRHRDAQRRAGERLVLGTFSLLPHLVRDSFALLMERGTELFAQPAMRPGVAYAGSAFCSGNASLPRSAFEAVGGFDEVLVYAGGEDSELGLRLEREGGLRVEYDPSIRCGHDHALDVLQLARRKRVIGWAAHKITERHPDAGILEPRELETTDWEALRTATRADAAELTRLIDAVTHFSAEEREQGIAPQGLDAVREIVTRIGELEHRRGMLCAHDGVLPTELAPEFTPALATNELQASPRAALPGSCDDPLGPDFDELEGMISRAEALALFDLAREVEEGVIVEVGSYRGRSTVALARGARAGAGAAVYAVEPHEAFRGVLGGEFGPRDRCAFFQNLLRAGCAEGVRLVNLSSEVVTPGWSQPVGLLWIDGDHSYRGVERDWSSWREELLPGAVVAFDDATDPSLGPAKLIAELVDAGVLEPLAAVGKVRILRHGVATGAVSQGVSVEAEPASPVK